MTQVSSGSQGEVGYYEPVNHNFPDLDVLRDWAALHQLPINDKGPIYEIVNAYDFEPLAAKAASFAVSVYASAEADSVDNSWPNYAHVALSDSSWVNRQVPILVSAARRVARVMDRAVDPNETTSGEVRHVVLQSMAAQLIMRAMLWPSDQIRAPEEKGAPLVLRFSPGEVAELIRIFRPSHPTRAPRLALAQIAATVRRAKSYRAAYLELDDKRVWVDEKKAA